MFVLGAVVALLGVQTSGRTYSTHDGIEIRKIVDRSADCIELKETEPNGYKLLTVENNCFQTVVAHNENCTPHACTAEPQRLSHGGDFDLQSFDDLGLAESRLEPHEKLRVEIHFEKEGADESAGRLVLEGRAHEPNDPDRGCGCGS